MLLMIILPKLLLMMKLQIFVRAIGEVCKILKVEPGQGGGGFRAISNAGEAGLQEVPHLHVHILGGRNLGPMVSKSQ